MTTDLFSVNEAAVFLHLRPSTLRSWILHRRISYLKLGRKVFLRKLDLQKVLDESLVPAQSERCA
jgi:excisionase family DNA binding protein